MLRPILILSLVATVSGCARIPTPNLAVFNNVKPAEPLPYKTRLLADRGAADFSVAVAAGGAGLDAVRESVRFEGTRYCLARFGSSEIEWQSTAGDPDAWIATQGPDGRQLYSGRCLGR